MPNVTYKLIPKMKGSDWDFYKKDDKGEPTNYLDTAAVAIRVLSDAAAQIAVASLVNVPGVAIDLTAYRKYATTKHSWFVKNVKLQ
jgi:hypothetical protein